MITPAIPSPYFAFYTEIISTNCSYVRSLTKSTASDINIIYINKLIRGPDRIVLFTVCKQIFFTFISKCSLIAYLISDMIQALYTLLVCSLSDSLGSILTSRFRISVLPCGNDFV